MKHILILTLVLFSFKIHAATYTIPVHPSISTPVVQVTHYAFAATDEECDITEWNQPVSGGNFTFNTANFDNKTGLFRIIIQASAGQNDDEFELGTELFGYHLYVDNRLPGGGCFIDEVGSDMMALMGTGVHIRPFATSHSTALFSTEDDVDTFSGNKGHLFFSQNETMVLTFNTLEFVFSSADFDRKDLIMIKDTDSDTQIAVPGFGFNVEEVEVDIGTLMGLTTGNAQAAGAA